TATFIAYASRLKVLGTASRLSNLVQALLARVIPPAPPPFVVRVLGPDFFDRTVVKLELTQDATGKFVIWWADGWQADWGATGTFAGNAQRGRYEQQEPEAGRILFDVLDLPRPNAFDRHITIGLQRVSLDGSGSPFVT